MQINIPKAIKDIHSDPLWKLKVPIGVILFVIVNLTFAFANPWIQPYPGGKLGIVCGAIVTAFLYVFIRGYYFKFLNNIFTDSNEFLPCWKDSQLIFNSGLKFVLGAFTLSLPITVIALIMLGAAVFSQSIQNYISVVFFIYFLLALFWIIFYLPFLVLMSLVFSYDLKLSSFFKFKKGLELLKNGKTKFYLIYLSWIIFMGVVAFASYLLSYQLWIIVLLSLLHFYFILAWVQILAQWANQNK